MYWIQQEDSRGDPSAGVLAVLITLQFADLLLTPFLFLLKKVQNASLICWRLEQARRACLSHEGSLSLRLSCRRHLPWAGAVLGVWHCRAHAHALEEALWKSFGSLQKRPLVRTNQCRVWAIRGRGGPGVNLGFDGPWAAIGWIAVVWACFLPVACNEYGCTSGRSKSVGSL